MSPHRQRPGEKAVHHNGPRRVGGTDGLYFLFDEAGSETPRVFDSQRVDRFVLDLPCHNRRSLFVAVDNAGDLRQRGIQKAGMRVAADELTLGQRNVQVMRRHKAFGITECLDRANADDELLAGALRRVNLPVELERIERASPRFETAPVRSDPD